MSLLDTLLSVVAPHECVACGSEGALLCGACLVRLPSSSRCYRCRQAAQGVICNNCAGKSLLTTYAVTQYEGVAKAAIHRLKFAGAQAAVQPIARALHATVKAMPERPAAIVPVPTAATRVRQRGYDQAVLLARELSRQSGVPCYKVLRRQGRSRQVGASREQRILQLEHAFSVAAPQRIQRAHLLLIDDVLTTGATLETAAQVLLNAGAAQISALVFAAA